MGAGTQLRLLLWKDLLIRRRHLGVATLVFGWAIGVFLILYIVRESVDLTYYPTCTYSARSLPSTGLFPFVQSFICNVDNKCNNVSQYEEVPLYKNARLTNVAKQLEGAFTNETIINVVKSLPNMIILLKAVGNGLDTPNLEGIFGEGIKIRSFFENPNKLKTEIKQNNPNLDTEIVDQIFDSSLKMGHLFKSFGSTDLGSSVCNPNELEKYLILQEPNNIDRVSKGLCNISGDMIPNLIQNIFDHADFGGLLKMIGKTVDHFTNYNPFDDIKSVVQKLLDLNFVKDNIPNYFKLKKWLPNIIPLMKNISRKHIDTDFITKSLAIIEPNFNDTPIYPKYKNLILHLMDLLVDIQTKIFAKGPLESQKYKTAPPKNFADFVTKAQNELQKTGNETYNLDRQEMMLKIFNDTLNILPVFYFNTSDPWMHIGNILDSLTAIIGNKYLDQFSVISYLYGQGVAALQNTLKHEYGSEKIMYSLCEKHSNIVSTLFSLGPEFITKMLHCFSNISCTNIIIEHNISQIFCDEKIMKDILPGEAPVKNIEILCNFDISDFLNDLVFEFDLDWINNTVIETEKRLKNMKNFTHYDSFTSAVERTENLLKFMKNKTIYDREINWEQLFPDIENSEWKYIASEARRNAGLYILNVQLSYLKESVKNKSSLNQFLNSTSILMEGFLTQYNLFPKSLMESVSLNLPQIVETVIKTFTNKTEIMILSSIDNWEQFFCNSTSDGENVVTGKIICEIIGFLNMQSSRPWFGQPLIASIFQVVVNDFNPKIELNWNQFNSDSQNMYLTLTEIMDMKIKNENWENFEVFQSKYWYKWVKSLSSDTALRFGIQVVSKIGDFIEKNYFDFDGNKNQVQLTSSVNFFINIVLNSVNFISSTEKDSEYILNDSGFYNLSKIISDNFEVLVLDLEKLIGHDNIIELEELKNWFMSPCDKSVSESVPNFSAQSAYTLIQIQNVYCNPEKYHIEWARAKSLISKNNLKINATTSKMFLETEELLSQAHRETKFEKIMYKILDTILENYILRQDTLRDLFKQLKDCQGIKNDDCKQIQLDTARYSVKFLNAGLQEVCTTVSQYLQLINGTSGVDPLRLIGFSNSSGIFTLYTKFSDFIKVFIHTYRSAEFEDKIFESRSRGQEFKCNDVMNNLIIPENNSVTLEDIEEITRYFCPTIFDIPVLDDNVFLRVINRLQDLYVDIPVSKLNVTFVHVTNSLFDLKFDIISMYKYGKINITDLWNKLWIEEIKNTFNEIKLLNFNSNNTLTRFFKYIDLPNDELNISLNLIHPKFGFGDFSFLLEKVTDSLESFSNLNLTSTELDSEDIEEIQNLVGIYTKQVASFLIYVYYKNPHQEFWNIFDKICLNLENSKTFYPEWMIDYNDKFLKKLCQISDEEVRNQLFPKNELQNIKNYNVNLEEIVIEFLKTLQNFVNNNSTIYLSRTIVKNFDLKRILNHTYPTEEELRNTSLRKAKQLSNKSPWMVLQIDEELQATTAVLKLLQGGNWWENLLKSVQEPTIKFWLNILEKTPTIIIHLSDAAISPRLLYEIASRVVTKGQKSLCDNDFNIKRYLRDDNLVAIVHNACLLKNKKELDIFDVYINETNIYYTLKEEELTKHIFDFEKSLIELVKQGPKSFELPRWMNESKIIQEYEEYSKLNKKPLKLLGTTTTVITEIIDIGSVFYKNYTESCTWCSWATMLVGEASKQLSKSSKYAEFLCKVPDMNLTQIKDTLINDFKWGELYDNIVGNKTYTVKEFDEEIHDIVDVIRVQLITFYTNKTLQSLPEKCFKKIVDTPALKNISTYISAVREMVDTIKNSSVPLLKTPLFANITQGNYSEILKIYIPVLKPFEIILKNSDSLKNDLENAAINNFTISEILSAKVDVNMLNNINSSEEIEKYFSNRDYFNKLFSFNNYSTSQIIQTELQNIDKAQIAQIFYENIDEKTLNTKIPKWRQESLKSFSWVTKIFESLEQVIFNGGNILEFISNIDFNEFSTGNFNISSMLKGILEILEKNSIEGLFQSLRELVRGLTPIIRNDKLENDLYNIIDAIEDMKIFKSLGLLRIKYKISELFKNWKDAKKYLINDIHLEENVAENLLNASIDLSQIMSSQGNSLNIRETICNPTELSKIMNFNTENPEIVSESVSKVLCKLSINEIQNIATVVFKHIDLSKALNRIMDSTVNTILLSANMTENEGKRVVKNIGTGVELLPYLKSMIKNISEDMKELPNFDALKSENGDKKSLVISPDLLASASTLLCGRPLVHSSNKLYKTISQAKDFNAEAYDAIEQESLPTEFCRNVYKDVVNMEIGKVIWAYIKPLLRGQILYTPNTATVRDILKNANTTFASIAELQDILFKITDSLTELQDRDNIEHILDNIQGFLNSSIVQLSVQNVIKSVSKSDISLKDINLKNLLNSFGDSKGISSALNFGSDFLHCVLLNRFVGVQNEERLEEQAKKLMQTNEFIAGIVFLNIETRNKRSIDLPSNISYKIRMDIDSVPSTSYLKYKFWTPGPDSDFLDELRYFRGFIQLQDLIDNAIIKLKSEESLPNWETLTQEMPYPCWTRDFFKSALAISQTFQVCFFFGLIAVVAAAVRYVVWEKESGNTMVMNVMGLRYITHCTSWFIVTLFEMLIVIIAIFIILKAGGILPMTDNVLLFLFLLDFGFSVIMFCYMISSMFNSASLAAVGSAIFYLLSFMPYIIIISLETTLEFWAKMITNLSMSTSFCYGCLYMIRFELQGVGLQWTNFWDTPIPGDNMNFGLTCLFLILDGILYGIIGYLCSRKSQGENYLDDTVSSTNIVNDEPLKIGVTIKGLTKIYNSRKKTVKAIEDIDISLYTGQVTTLLGHNGAGKTTLIKILTGMMKPTSGQIIINSEITENDKDKSRFLGVCPQGSVLINTMTPKEHLVFYAKLKTQKSTADVMPEVIEMIESMNLGFLSNEPVSNLSEGMRRRLCVAIAFIGKPKLVVLDEPSSGVDPVARRQIWDLVIRYKEGCTVLLSTHYLDEAELLSDRVVVLHRGKVLCSGSPLILRQSYGSGYKITISYPEVREERQLNDTAVNAVVSLVKNISSNAFLSEIRGFILDITVPFTSTDGVPNDFEKVALALEENQSLLGFSSFNINCATLEQVFLDLCEQADFKENDLKNADTISQLGKSYSTVFTNSIDELPNLKDDEVLIDTGEKLTGTSLKKFLALLKKRAIHCTYDWRVIVCALILPTLFTAVAMGFSLIRPPNSYEPSLKLTPDLYREHSTSFISVETNDMSSFVNKVSKEIVGLSPHNNLDMYIKNSRHCKCRNGKQQCEKSSNPVYDSLMKLSTANETIDWIVDTQNEYIERRYGGWSLSDQYQNKSAMIVWYNNKGYHSMPSYLNTMNSAILRTISPGSTITTYNHPLKLSVDQLSRSSIAQHIADVGIAMVLLIAFSLVPASGSIYLVQERINEEKRMQFLCGVSPTLYWLVAFVWDLIILLCALALSVIVFKIFGLPVYVDRDNMAAVSLLIFLYGWACIPFIHLAQRLFKDASMANMILFCICTFIGISELTCLLLMDILGKTQFVADLRDILHNIYLIFPQFVLGDGLVEISKNNIQAEILKRFHMDTYVSPLSWDLMGVHYLSLAIVGFVLFFINLIIENEWLIISKKRSKVSPADAVCLEIINLTKKYNTVSGQHAAVNDINLKVPFGQCLGLIGVNGAGKSTTFKMLTTELRPSFGRILLQGREICRKPLYTGEIGYCPQCDALDPKLTVRQTLQLYLTLRGIENKNEILNKIMSKFELTNYANRRNENLSGGNRRKLCTALSVLGKTSLILMDEPTSGMDPYSRNLVGITIQQLIKQNRSVILTSHSVEDCEALCSNVAVMINGRIICQGSPQNLKERYGSGYIISVKLSKPTEQDLLLNLMKKYFPGAELMSRQYCSSQFAVPTDRTKISDMFSIMTKISGYASVEDYNLVQSSLDQVFINLATKSDATIVVDLDSKPNMYAMNVIQ